MSKSKATPKASAHARRIPDLHKFISDFRTGLGKLKDLTQRLRQSPSRDLPPSAAGAARTEHREIMRTLERELKLIERVAPPELRERVVSEFRSKAESAIQMGIPQAYAQLAEAANIAPATAIRPQQVPAVRSVLKAVKAIKSGRLAFLPRRTRVEARKLLQAIFSAPKALRPLSGARMASAVAQQRLLPSVVQGMMRSYDNPAQSKLYIDIIEAARKRQLDPDAPESSAAAPTNSATPTPSSSAAPVNSSMPAARSASFEAPQQSDIALEPPVSAPDSPTPHRAPAPLPTMRPLSPQATARLAKAIPAFESEGMATDRAPGEMGLTFNPMTEGAVAVGKNSELTTANDIDEPPRAPGTPRIGAGAAGSTPSGGASAIRQAPASTSTAVATKPDTEGGSGGSAGGDVRVTGSLTIDGLPGFIARTEMRLKGLEAATRNQNG